MKEFFIVSFKSCQQNNYTTLGLIVAIPTLLLGCFDILLASFMMQKVTLVFILWFESIPFALVIVCPGSSYSQTCFARLKMAGYNFRYETAVMDVKLLPSSLRASTIKFKASV